MATGTGLNSAALISSPNSSAEHRDRQEHDQQIEDEAPRGGLAVQGERRVQQLLPEFPAHREDGGRPG